MFFGSMVALITPMQQDGRVDEAAVRHLVNFQIENGSSGIIAVGTTGESATLDEIEHCDMIRLVVEAVAGRVPVIAGTGSNATTEAIMLSRCAKQAGANASLSVTPYYNKPTQEGLYRHFKAIAETVNIPQILYNVPSRTTCDLLPETVARLSLIPNIIGIKEATGNIERAMRIRELCGPEFAIYSGDDATAMELVLQCGQGVISVTANIAPKQMSLMINAAVAKNRVQAIALDAPLRGLHKALFIEANPIPVKWAAAKLGLCGSGIRLPLTWLSEEAEPAVTAAMRQAGLINA